MPPRTLTASLFALYAGEDSDFGIRDPELLAECVNTLRAMDPSHLRETLTRAAREEFMTEYAIALGYGIEDVVSFDKWLNEQGIRWS